MTDTCKKCGSPVTKRFFKHTLAKKPNGEEVLIEQNIFECRKNKAHFEIEDYKEKLAMLGLKPWWWRSQQTLSRWTQ